MGEINYQSGELVVLNIGDWKGYTGVVSWPITDTDAGYVLICSDGQIAGVKVSHKEIMLADENAQGFTQLAYHLIRLSSYVIEKRILQPYKTTK